jgi:CDGSH-type Zn-finger protein
MKIVALENGPILLQAETKTIALCRCGKTQSRPHCDGCHAKNGFKAKGVPIWPESTSTEEVSGQ